MREDEITTRDDLVKMLSEDLNVPAPEVEDWVDEQFEYGRPIEDIEAWEIDCANDLGDRR